MITLTLTSSTILPAFAEGKKSSVFQKIEDFINEPFLSIEKAVGGEGQKRQYGSSEPVKHKPFFSSWVCQILVGDASKLVGANSQDTNNLMSLCVGKF